MARRRDEDSIKKFMRDKVGDPAEELLAFPIVLRGLRQVQKGASEVPCLAKSRAYLASTPANFEEVKA